MRSRDAFEATAFLIVLGVFVALHRLSTWRTR